ncbi:MAG: MT-A70 family methyltransferase [Acidobacteria bacterium]|nr:MT-A70 family methyltransferase [Acidobacteriota bacterium]
MNTTNATLHRQTFSATRELEHFSEAELTKPTGYGTAADGATVACEVGAGYGVNIMTCRTAQTFQIDPEFRALIPQLAPAELALLEANILADGCRDALVVWAEQGLLVDGHNRFQICKKHGLPFALAEMSFADREAACDWIDGNQLGRRNLGPDQMSILRGRRYNRTKKAQGGRSDRTFGEDTLSTPKTAEMLAAQHGVTERTIRRDGKRAEYFEQLVQTHPEQAQAVLDGEKRLNEVKRVTRLDAVREAAALPGAKYRVLLCDPPWKYGDGLTEAYGGTQFHYPSMSIAELSALGIPSICEPNAVLFLWATSPMLREALEVCGAWNFQYKAMFVWDKIKHNMGHYNSVRHELLLICTRGTCLPDVPELIDSVVSIDRTGHSEKPEEFRAIIDKLYPHGKRVELFARKAAEGWDRWGNQS